MSALVAISLLHSDRRFDVPIHCRKALALSYVSTFSQTTRSFDAPCSGHCVPAFCGSADHVPELGVRWVEAVVLALSPCHQ
ncbi:hypothetical protein RSAG8_13182, partial [Rhizoctonia solani AG-8 WAC10335]